MGRFVIDLTVEIEAPAALVWEVVSDLPRYDEWNPFIVACASTLRPGDPIAMQVKLGGKVRPQREWVTEFTKGRGFTYCMTPVPLSLSSRRSHEIEPLEGERCRYRSCFYLDGWLRHLVLLQLRRPLEAGFAGMTAAIKARAEALWAERLQG